MIDKRKPALRRVDACDENGIYGNLGTSGGKVRQIRSEMEKKPCGTNPAFLGIKNP